MDAQIECGSGTELIVKRLTMSTAFAYEEWERFLD
jgi:hypothetical protein